jgi:DNA modification methylase
VTAPLSDIPDSFFTVHQADARQLGRVLDRYSSQDEPLLTCTITSPPYGSLKNYGTPDQIGWGQPYDEYLIELRRVFRSIYRHTRMDGSMWLIVDTLRSDPTAFNPFTRVELLPFQLAQEAAESGWILRETVIWQKDKTLPWSSASRLRNAFEYLLLFAKSSSYKYRLERLRDPVELKKWWVKWPERHNPHGKVPTNVWEYNLPVQGSWKAPAVQHACPLPPRLVERLLQLSTDEGDVVLDPFAGTGVVVAEAEHMKRRGIGIELNPAYVRAYKKIVLPEIRRRPAYDPRPPRVEEAARRRDALIKLRALKYPKALVQQLAKQHPRFPRPEVVGLLMDKFDKEALSEPARTIAVRTVFGVSGDAEMREDLHRVLKEIAERPPVSKYGVTGPIDVVPTELFGEAIKRKRLYVYVGGRTWWGTGPMALDKAMRSPAPPLRSGQYYDYPPIVSNLQVRVEPEA